MVRVKSALKILINDIKDGNNLVHELLVRLRMTLALKSDLTCNIIDPSLSQISAEMKHDDLNNPLITLTKDLLSQASFILYSLRENPDIIIKTLSTIYKPSDQTRLFIAYIILHRVLHPFSSDSIMTTKLLVEVIKNQVNQSDTILELYKNIDKKIVISRSILIYDANTALYWNPLAQPMPMVPNMQHETVLSCLFRVLSIRRDITSFFRTIWRPAIPSVIAIIQSISSDNTNGNHAFANLLNVAKRILDCTFHVDAMKSFPSVLRSICQHIFDIGGNDAIHGYILNLLILPNLIKILKYDHDSIANESYLSIEEFSQLINQYYNLDDWWPLEGFYNAPFNPLNSLIWFIWRLYTGSVYLDEGTIANITCDQFFLAGPNLDKSLISDKKLRNILIRLQHKIDKSCHILLNQDTRSDGRSLNNLNPGHSDINYDSEFVKPPELLTYTIISRQELTFLLNDLMKYYENYQQSNNYHHDLFNKIYEYNISCEMYDSYITIDDNKVLYDIFIVPFSYPDCLSINKEITTDSNDDEHIALSNELRLKLKQLRIGLNLVNRYEDSLRNMINSLSLNKSNPIDLLNDLMTDKSCYIAPEFNANFIIEDVPLYNKHTTSSKTFTRNSHHGLFQPPDNYEYNQIPITTVNDIKYKTRSMIHEEMINSLRFGSTKASAGVGTSIARQKHIKSKPKYQPVSKQQSLVNPKSSYLITTESLRAPHMIQQPNRFTWDKEFMNSMRGHDVIPTNEFLYKKMKNKIRHYSHSNSSSKRDDIQLNIRSNDSNNVKEFPDHLRHFIRAIDHNFNDNTTNDDSNIDISKLISDYQSIFQSVSNNQSISDNEPVRSRSNSVTSSKSGSSYHMNRLFDYRPNESYIAPTQSVLNRIDDASYNKEISNRNNKSSTTYKHPTPFRPGGIAKPRPADRSYSSDEDYNYRKSRPKVKRNISSQRGEVSNRDVSSDSNNSYGYYSRDNSPERRISYNYQYDIYDYNNDKINTYDNDDGSRNNVSGSPDYDITTLETIDNKLLPSTEYVPVTNYLRPIDDNVATSYINDSFISNDEESSLDNIIDSIDDNQIEKSLIVLDKLTTTESELNRIVTSKGNVKFQIDSQSEDKLWNIDVVIKLFENGFNVIKYTKAGYPQNKLLQYNSSTRSIQWNSTKNDLITSLFSKKTESISRISLDDILEVHVGTSTHTNSTIDSNCCLSIKSKQRVLDIVCHKKNDCDMIYLVLNRLLNN